MPCSRACTPSLALAARLFLSLYDAFIWNAYIWVRWRIGNVTLHPSSSYAMYDSVQPNVPPTVVSPCALHYAELPKRIGRHPLSFFSWMTWRNGDVKQRRSYKAFTRPIPRINRTENSCCFFHSFGSLCAPPMHMNASQCTQCKCIALQRPISMSVLYAYVNTPNRTRKENNWKRINSNRKMGLPVVY